MNDINEIYRRASLKAGFSFISMYDLFEAYLKDNAIPLSSLLCDGLHPNDSGYDVMLALITGALGISK